MAKEIGEEYASSLSDLTVNSKPLINMLTILAEENIVHAGVIVETVEKHLEKVPSDIKLPVLYLVDSIIKNVGAAYTQKFAQSIVSMFTKTFKVVDEKTRSQMFKLRDTWHDVFPSTKLYQLDVKVNLIDPAWPIQAQPQPQQANIHFNPHFLKKPVAPAIASVPVPTAKSQIDEEEKMRLVLAQKEQELMMLQQKKVEMELELKRQMHVTDKNVSKPPQPGFSTTHPASLATSAPMPDSAGPVRQRMGVPKSTGRIAPVSGAMISAVRDPRLAARLQQSAPPQPISPNVFDIKPLERTAKVVKRKNVLTIDVTAENIPTRPENGSRDPRPRREPRTARNRNFEKRPEIKERFRARQDKRKAAEEIRKKDLEKTNCQYEDVDKQVKSNQFLKEDVIEDFQCKAPRSPMEELVPIFPTVDRKKINKLPPIPKLSRQDDSKPNHVNKTEESAPSPSKRKKETVTRSEKKSPKKRDNGKESSDSSSSPDKRNKTKDKANRCKNKEAELFEKIEEDPVIPFKELKNYHKERYMRRNKEKSESPDVATETRDAPDVERAEDTSTKNSYDDEERSSYTRMIKVVLDNKPKHKDTFTDIPDIVVENMDVDLRRLPPAASAAPIVQKRPSTEALENKTSKKHKLDKLFGSEDVDLRQLPHVEETSKAQAVDDVSESTTDQETSPKKDWSEFKEKNTFSSAKDNPEFAVVRAKLAEATKGKDRLGRKPRFSTSMEDTDFRINNKTENLDTENDKETIKIIMSQAEENYKSGSMGKEQYNTLMFQIMQIHEKLKLKEAKQRESLEESKRKLHNVKPNEDSLEPVIKNDNNFGDIDERITPIAYIPRDTSDINMKDLHGDSDLRVKNHLRPMPEPHLRPKLDALPRPPLPPMIPAPPFPLSKWRGSRMRTDDFNVTRPRVRGPMPPFHRGGHAFSERAPLLPMPLPIPAVGMYQGESPLNPYTRVTSPPPLGTPGIHVLPADYKVIEYIDQDPMKTIEIDGVSREIRFYGRTAVVMLDWETPKEIRFFPGTRRITFDNKDSLVLVFNEDYTKAEVDDQVFDIRFGAPTRELYINNKWYECYFGGPPVGIMIEGVPRLIQLEGPPPQVDIGTEKRTDLVAGKINMIIDATHMFPVFLDAKPQKFTLHNVMHTIRFVDALKTVLINEIPFKIEFGGLPKPIFFGGTKHFIRFSVLPRWVKPGQVKIANMEGRVEIPPAVSESIVKPISELIIEPAEDEDEDRKDEVEMEIGKVQKDEKVKEESTPMEVVKNELPHSERAPHSPEMENSNPGLDILASVMPTSMAPLSQFSRYSIGSTGNNNQIPGLDTPADEKPPTSTGLPFLGSINVNDLFAKLIATGIVPKAKEENVMEVETDVKPKVKEDVKVVKEDRNTIKVVNLLKPETLRVKQPGIVARLYGGMQCCSCGARFPPEHTVRYSQHLDWHFRQNRRERDSARRAHSRRWHYDLPDWVQYEEVEDLDDREKSWFETNPTEGATEVPVEPAEGETPSVPAGEPQQQFCALCGDKFDQFYNEDKEEWHLRKAVCHEEKNYHPLCFEDFKASQNKPETKPEQELEGLDMSENLTEDEPSIILIDRSETPIEIRDDTRSQSDTESVVEVLDEDKEEAVEIEEEDEGDEDDVVLKAEPVEQLEVDDADTDDETQELRTGRDKQAAIDFANIKIKQEPIDPDDEPIITAEEQVPVTNPDTSSHIVTSSIDGNVQLTTRATTELQTIRINISTQRPTVTVVAPTLEPIVDDEEPMPPGEEIELEYSRKPTLEGVEFIKKPPVQKGSELSGLCSIM